MSKALPSEIVDFITKTGISPSAIANDGKTALGEAVLHGNLEVTKLLIDMHQVPLDSLNKN